MRRRDVGSDGEEIVLAYCRVHLGRRQVHRDGRVLPLTELEAGLLRYLAAHSDRIVGREELQLEVWRHRKASATRAVDNTVSRLRKKIELQPEQPRSLRSHHGGGYSLSVLATMERQRTGLVGRASALDTLATELARHGAVCLVGPGGIGKTSLAVEHSDQVASSVHVDLSEVDSAAEVTARVAAAVGSGGAEGLARTLAARGEVLLVLDGVERVHAALADLVSTLRSAAPRARVLATSRVRPPDLCCVEVGPLDADDAVALFLARAARGIVDDPELQALLDDLERLPLAIELAASRTWALPVREIRRRLGERFALLRRSTADVLPRHAALRETIAWSWALLEPAWQDAVADLATFRGGFTAEAAEAVLGPDALNRLEVLRDHSLLRSSERDTPRLRLYDAVRDYAIEVAGHRPLAERRAADWLAAPANPLLPGSDLDAEADNLVGAWEWARDNDPALAGRLLLSHHRCRPLRYAVRAFRARIDETLTFDLPPELRAELLLRGAVLSEDGRSPDARIADLREALPLLTNEGSRSAASLVWATILEHEARDHEALPLLRNAVRHRAAHASGTEAGEMGRLAVVLARIGEAFEARAIIARARVVASRTDFPVQAAFLVGCEAFVDQALGDAERAERGFVRARENLDSAGELPVGLSLVPQHGILLLLRGAIAEADRTLAAAEAEARKRCHVPILAHLAFVRGLAAWSSDRPDEAVALLEEAGAAFAERREVRWAALADVALAGVAAERHRPSEAAQHADRVATRLVDRPNLWADLTLACGWRRLADGRRDDLLAEIDLVLARRPVDAVRWLALRLRRAADIEP